MIMAETAMGAFFAPVSKVAAPLLLFLSSNRNNPITLFSDAIWNHVLHGGILHQQDVLDQYYELSHATKRSAMAQGTCRGRVQCPCACGGGEWGNDLGNETKRTQTARGTKEGRKNGILC